MNNSTHIFGVLTHWGWDEIDAILQTPFSNAFLLMKMYAFKISLKFVPKGPIDNIPALVQKMVWCPLGDKPLSQSMMVSLLMHICNIRLDELMWKHIISYSRASWKHIYNIFSRTHIYIISLWKHMYSTSL